MTSSLSADQPRPLMPPTQLLPGRPVLPHSTVPAPLTPFVGRERELAMAVDRLRSSAVRLLTLTGPGGVGKTRLLLRLADALASDFPSGITFVPLAPVDHSRQLLLAIASALGVPDTGDSDLVGQLASVLDGWPRLLLLDNFEQLVESGPALTALLEACPNLKIAVTSRVVLRLTGEHELAVPPLAVPGLSRSRSLADATGSDAIALFVMRASAVNPAFELTGENTPAVVEICRRLDGLPLAIELAAARTKVLTPQALAERLGNRLQILIGGPRDQPARLQTMRGAIAWSYDLLTPDEQELFRKLSVFPAGLDLSAAEQVVGSDRVLDGIASLVDKSLLQHPDGTGGETRFAMLETIRAFGLEQLAEYGEEPETRRRHAAWCQSLVAQVGVGLHVPPSQSSLDRLEQEHDSLRTALDWLLESGEVEQAAQMVVDAWWFWFTHSHLRVGHDWSTRVLERIGPEVSVLRVRLQLTAGWFTEATGDFVNAQRMHEEALDMARQLGDPATYAMALYALADVVDEHRPDDRPLTWFEETATLFRSLDADPWLATTLNAIGAIHRDRGDFDQAVAFVEEGLAVSRRCQFLWATGLSFGHLARISRMRGDLDLASTQSREAIRIWHDLGDWWRLSRAVNELGIIAERSGQFRYAASLLGASEAVREQLGGAFMPLLSSAWERAMTNLHRQLGDTEFTAAWDAGQAMTLDELMSFVVNTPEPASAPVQQQPSSKAGLSSREMDVLRLLVGGLSDRQIAETLFISHRTAQGHVGSIFNKLSVNSRTAAATTAIRLGLVGGENGEN